jgi:hypothetical protein
VILESKVYSNAFTGLLGLNTHDDATDDARTVIEATSDLPVRAIDAPELQISINSLKVCTIWATLKYDQPDQSVEADNLKRGDTLHGLRRMTRSRYQGNIIAKAISIPEKLGQFERATAVLGFGFETNLKLRTTSACDMKFDGLELVYTKGQKLLISVSADNLSMYRSVFDLVTANLS